MKCAFICAGLEPGLDGVGDYSRILAHELRGLRHDVSLVALNDSHLEQPAESTDPFPVLRLPQSQPWDSRTQAASVFLAKHAPDWLSFQFVPYGFHPKGLVRKLPGYTQPLCAGRRTHIMFHEIWIGAKKHVSLKERIYGLLQRPAILRWAKSVRPSVVHSSNAAYTALLRRGGLDATELPLFGNIPLCPPGPFRKEILARLGINPAQRDNYWLLGVFGGLPEEWNARPLLRRVLLCAQQKGKKVAWLAIGKHGRYGDAALARAVIPFQDTIPFIDFGPQSEQNISDCFAALDFGISTSSLLLLGKSGAGAAMLEHGLPLLVHRNDVQFSIPVPPPSDPQIIFLDDDFESKLVAARRRAPESGRPRIAQALLSSLQSQ